MVSDFDVVLERLLSDPVFAAALAADPAGALAGYRLEPDEVALLHTQVAGDSGGQSGVEVRANQSSMFGMLSPLTGLAGALPGYFDPGPGASPVTAGLGPAGDGVAGMGSREPVQGMGPRTDPIQGMGPGDAGTPDPGVPPAAQGGAAGSVPPGLAAALAAGTGPGPVGTGLAGVLAGSEPGFPGFGSAGTPPAGAPGDGSADPPQAPPAPIEPVVPDGYRTWVDVDGDGNWDRHELRGRADGGVDITVDSDGDGRVDFVGHDLDADGLVDVSEYDRDGDGFFERRMYDDDGDGWMDRSIRVDRPADPAG